MYQFELSLNKKQQLLDICNDYNLPVSSHDDITVLENYLKVISDENPAKAETETNVLTDDEKFSRKAESALMISFRKILKLKLQH
jgi:hypothetical protein